MTAELTFAARVTSTKCARSLLYTSYIAILHDINSAVHSHFKNRIILIYV